MLSDKRLHYLTSRPTTAISSINRKGMKSSWAPGNFSHLHILRAGKKRSFYVQATSYDVPRDNSYILPPFLIQIQGILEEKYYRRWSKLNLQRRPREESPRKRCRDGPIIPQRISLGKEVSNTGQNRTCNQLIIRKSPAANSEDT